MNTRRKTRQSSNVFHMLTKNQILELREAFNLMDSDSDSRLTVNDLSVFLQSIGSPFSDGEIKEMVAELEPNPTFMILLTCIGEKLSEIAAEADLIESFRIFDEDNDGYIDKELLKYWMTEQANKISEKDFEYLVRGCEDEGKIDYKKLTTKIKHGEFVE
jgi:myosin regulatory light chain 12